jgi:diguanylate cyclase (GGDEF)-like protein/PAS domain S-box-containing protein
METLRTRSIDLMLLDLQLSDGTGLDLLRKSNREGVNVPSILITAHGSEQVVVEALRLGVLDYLSKPIDTDLLSAAITRALASERLKKEKSQLMAKLKEQVEWLTVLSRVGQSLASTLDVDEVLRRIVEAGVHLTRADEGFLALLDKGNGQLTLRAVKNIDHNKVKTMRIPVEDSLMGNVITSARPIRVSQDDSHELLKVTTGFLVSSLIHVPILSKGKAFGVLSVDNRVSKRAFKEMDEAMLTSLADYAAVAIENASLYEKARQEIAERKRVEIALRESEERYALAMRGANDGIWDWDLKTNRVYYSTRWKAMLGYEDDEVGESPNEWFTRVHMDDREDVQREITKTLRGANEHFQCEHRMNHKNGSFHWMLSRAIAVWDDKGAPIRMVGSLSDINDRKYAEAKLSHNAFHDTLTDLPNRTLFMDHLGLAIQRSKRKGAFQYGVLFIDLDRFKDINDSLGHMIGDQLLVAIAKMLQQELRSTDTVARFGGDEFVILLEDVNDTNDIIMVASRILSRFSVPFYMQNNEVYMNASIGVVVNTSSYENPEDVLRDADIAMYQAKMLGRGRYEIFEPNMRDRILDRLMLENDLRFSFERKELCLVYQPIVSITDQRITGFEALIRWQHPERGILSPGDFIPLAEETGLILPIGRWVLQESCRQLKAWQEEFQQDPPLTISVNVSGKQLAQADFFDQVIEALRISDLDPHTLKLEITESAIMDNLDFALDMFNRLREQGIQVQVDDFGIGYSSLSYLSHFPIDALKIDRSFVRLINQDVTCNKIVQTIIMLAHGLEIGVIAEGVEIADQWEQVKNLGCEQAQGYFIARPSSKEIMEKILAEKAIQTSIEICPPAVIKESTGKLK